MPCQGMCSFLHIDTDSDITRWSQKIYSSPIREFSKPTTPVLKNRAFQNFSVSQNLSFKSSTKCLSLKRQVKTASFLADIGPSTSSDSKRIKYDLAIFAPHKTKHHCSFVFFAAT